MKYILRKFIDADSVQDAVRKDRKTPVHDCYLKDGEAPSDGGAASAIGFSLPAGPDELHEMRRRR
jgi:hypothetical protein